MDVVLVKSSGPGHPDRTYVSAAEGSRRVPVHPVHDLPHLVVESLFAIGDGLWGELIRGEHAETEDVATARDPKRRKLGRIVSGAAAGKPTDAWLSAGHRLAKLATNSVVNRWGDGPDTPAGVRQRLRHGGEAGCTLDERLDDETIAAAIRGVRELERRWAALPPGGKLQLQWPLAASSFDPP